MLADDFREARLPTAGVHVDVAACGRASGAVLDAVAAHARHESEIGGYVTQAAAAPALDAGRAAVAALLGFAADDVAFVESASSALTTLLAAWPFPAGSRVAVARNEWGPNLAAFADRGLATVEVPLDAGEHLDLTALSALLRTDPPQLVSVNQVASHRGVVQPVADVVALCHAAGVPVVVDASQALGHVDAVSDADATFATSRKWLCGPRGVGMLAVRATLAGTLVPRAPAMGPERWPLPGPPMLRLESAEAHVAGRVGLSVAVGEFLAHDPVVVFQALREVGRRTRLAFADLPGWRVVEPAEEPCAITTLRPAEAVDLLPVRARLLEVGFVTTVSGIPRAPRQMTAATLRVSPHVDVTDTELELLAAALAGQFVGGAG